MPTRRPTTFTLIAIPLAWLALGGFGLALLAPTVPTEEFSQLKLHAPTLAALGLAYGVSAMLLAVGLWRVATWTPHAVLLWGASVYASVVALSLMTREAVSPWWLAVLVYVLPAVPLFALHRHVRGTLSRTSRL